MLTRWQRTIVDAAGNIVPGAVLWVRRESDQALATVYKDRAGTIPYSMGQITADDSGYVYFYAPSDFYRLTSVDPAIDWRDVNIGDAKAMQVLDVVSQQGMVAYETRNDMDADDGQSAGTLGWVFNDIVGDNNAYYIYSGVAWVKTAYQTRGAAGEDVINRGDWVTGSRYYPGNFVRDLNSDGEPALYFLIGDEPYISSISPKDDAARWSEMVLLKGDPGEVQWDDLGTAAVADTGTSPGQVPTNEDLSDAARTNIGTKENEIPINSDLSGAEASEEDAVNFNGSKKVITPNILGQVVNYEGKTWEAPDDLKTISIGNILRTDPSVINALHLEVGDVIQAGGGKLHTVESITVDSYIDTGLINTAINKYWYGVAEINGKVIAAPYAGKLAYYNQLTGAVEEIATSTSRNWTGLCVLNGVLYGCVYAGLIYVINPDDGTDTAVTSTNRNWRGLTTDGTLLYSINDGGTVQSMDIEGASPDTITAVTATNRVNSAGLIVHEGDLYYVACNPWVMYRKALDGVVEDGVSLGANTINNAFGSAPFILQGQVAIIPGNTGAVNVVVSDALELLEDVEVTAAYMLGTVTLDSGACLLFPGASNNSQNIARIDAIIPVRQYDIVLNYEHSPHRGNGGLRLTDEAIPNGQVKLIKKWHGAPVGLGQAWVDCGKGIRQTQVIYQNNTGRAIQVYLPAYAGNGGIGASFSVDGNEWLNLTSYASGGGYLVDHAQFIVPRDHFYKSTTTGVIDNAHSKWFEMR